MVEKQLAKLAISGLVGFKRGLLPQKSTNLSLVRLDFSDSLVNVQEALETPQGDSLNDMNSKLHS